MHLSEFNVVLVDDEPDVLEVSRLAMRHFKVYGLPIRLHTASSKAQGIDVLEGLTLGRRDISMASVALIDVVMETDHAGLELCDHIREVMKNRTMQLYVRTGQPGVAPERRVLDRYDIQGYLSKVEATEDKLYTVVKAGIRQSAYAGLSHALQDLMRFLIPAATSRDALVQRLQEWQRLARQTLAGSKADTIRSALAYVVDGEFVAGAGAWQDAGEALARRDALAALPSQPLGEGDDRFTVDGNDLLIQIAPSPQNAGVQYLLRGTTPPPDWEIFLYHRYLRSFSALWKLAC